MFSETSMIKDYKDTMSFNCKRARVWEVALTFQTKQNTHKAHEFRTRPNSLTAR